MMKKLKIAQIVPFFETVPPRKYGGIELVVYNLIQYLLHQGHSVTLFSAGKNKKLPSQTKHIQVYKKTVREIIEKNNLNPKTTALSFEYIGLVNTVLKLKDQKFDIIHSHVGWHLFPFKPLLTGKIVVTLHGPLAKKYTESQYFYHQYQDENYVSISKSQRKPIKINFVGNAYNGIDYQLFDFKKNSGNYLAWLGRISPEKGPVQAILAAKKAGEKLKIAAKIDPYDKDFWQNKVKPLIDGKQIEYIGEVDHKGKNNLLGGAKALLALIQWEEPFGLFFTEALACGTPVIATPRGSVPEIIEDGKNGFFAKNVSEAVQAIKKISTIDRQYCRRSVKQRFSKEAMGAAYEEIYQRILK